MDSNTKYLDTFFILRSLNLLMTYAFHNGSDYGCFYQSSVLHSQPKSTVGTPAYIAPEVLLRKEYDGKVNWV